MLEGRIENGVHRLPVRIYYEDTDFSGLVYHANYLKFCERGRSDYIRLVEIDQNEMAVQGIAFVVRRMVCDFKRAARFDDIITVETWGHEMSGARFEIKHRILKDDVELFTADATVAIVDRNGRPQRIPAEFAVKFPIVTVP